jgi:four helix bundle protein
MISGESIFSTEGFKVSEFQGFVAYCLRSFREKPVARSYRDLLVWQKAKALAVHIYQATEQFPRNETYGLTSQIRRAAVSVASNIAEGQGRLTLGEFLHFLGQARGSLLELDTQVAIALDLTYLKPDRHEILEREIYQVLGLINRLIESLRKSKASKL